MKDAKLNNLLSIETFTENKFAKKAKTTKRTDVANDVLQENAYVVGKDVLGDKLKNKEVHAAKGLNNLISLEDFTKSVPSTKDKTTKRTETGKDVILEKKKSKSVYDDDDDDEVITKKEKMKKGGKGDKEEEFKGLTAKQKKLPEAFQKAILRKQGKK